MGAILGATIDRDAVAHFAAWPVSLAGLLISLVLLMVAVPLYFQRVHGIDRATAWISSVPGALSYVVALASDLAGVDLRRVAVLQTLRVAALIALFPAAAGLFTQIVPFAAEARPVVPWPTTAIVLLLAFLSVPIWRALRLPSPTFIAPMFLTGGLSVAGLFHGDLPVELLWPSLVVSGCAVGLRFAGTSARFLWHCLKAGLGGLVVALAITCGVALVVAPLTGLPYLQLCLAYAPGALDVMPVLAFAFGLDPAFVAGHQLVRFLALSLALPFLTRGLAGPPDAGRDA